jgi:hypothetical protein
MILLPYRTSDHVQDHFVTCKRISIETWTYDEHDLTVTRYYH